MRDSFSLSLFSLRTLSLLFLSHSVNKKVELQNKQFVFVYFSCELIS